MILAAGVHRDESGDLVPAWHGQQVWIGAVADRLVSDEGKRLLTRLHTTAVTVMAVAMVDAQAANARTGGDVATSNATVGRRVRKSVSVVQRARRVLILLGLAAVVQEGRYLTRAERAAAGGKQIRAASTRVLKTPPGPPRRRPRRSNDHLPAKRVRTPSSPVPERSPSRPVDNSPAPMWAQKLAARIAERMPRLVRDRHIGNLVTGLMNLALPTGVTAGELLSEIEYHGPPEPSTPVRDPLAWFLHQASTVAGRILDRWDKPTSPLQHVHSYRAILSPTTRGCLTCPATKELP